MGQGQDLSIGMLSEDNDLQEDFMISKEESLSINLDGSSNTDELETKTDKNDKGDKNNTNDDLNNFSEEETLESVAEEDKGKAPEAQPSPGSDKDMSHIYSSLAAHFHEKGVLPSLNLDEDKIKSADDLQNAIKKEIDNSISERQKAYEEAINKGEPESDYVRYSKQKESLDAITDEVIESNDSETLRFNIIAQDFVNKKFSKEDAIKYARRSQELGEDIADAKKAITDIRNHNETSYKSKVAEKQQKELDAVEKIKSFINSKDEIIKGIKLNDVTKNKLLKQMTTAVGRDSKGEPITEYGKALIDDPVKTKAVTEYMFLITKGFTDFSKINNLITTKANKNIDDLLRSTGGDFLNTGKVNFNNTDNNSTFSIGDKFELDI